jgi:hypothetical protein
LKCFLAQGNKSLNILFTLRLFPTSYFLFHVLLNSIVVILIVSIDILTYLHN